VAWPYVNGDIHIGHLVGYLLPADIFARFHRFRGNDVLMVSGSDCFGTPITVEADKRKIKPQDIVNEYHAKNVALFKKLGLTFDNYTKTDTENHKKIVQDFFLKLLEKDLIFKKTTKQYYSTEEKRFLPDRYVEGVCPHCGYAESRSDQCDKCGAVINEGELKNPKSKLSGGEVVLKPTEHYFLDWQKLQKFLEKYVATNGNKWRQWVLDETKGWLKKGLEARAITRDLDWGVEIPIDKIPEDLQIDNVKNKRIYVWFDAVIGYLSASIEWTQRGLKQNKTQTNADTSWEDWWKNKGAEHYYFMGKDNLIFHTLFWPGQLYSYDEKLHLPDAPIINQFLNLEGQKFSKSRGVTIASDYMADTYGNDTLRFYLAMIMPENADASFDWTDFVAKNNNILIATIGNFINRAVTLAKGIDFQKAKIDSAIQKTINDFLAEGINALEKEHSFKKYADAFARLADFGNKYITKEEPWAIKDGAKKTEVMSNAIALTIGLLVFFKPLMPDAYNNLSKQLGVDIKIWDEKLDIQSLLRGVKISTTSPLFKKLDEGIIEVERAKIKKL